MSTSREKVYRCTFITRAGNLTGHVRAWDEREAAQLFREELATTGITARGKILVKDLAGNDEHQVSLAS
jgi:hypothetical protein